MCMTTLVHFFLIKELPKLSLQLSLKNLSRIFGFLIYPYFISYGHILKMIIATYSFLFTPDLALKSVSLSRIF